MVLIVSHMLTDAVCDGYSSGADEGGFSLKGLASDTVSLGALSAGDFDFTGSVLEKEM